MVEFFNSAAYLAGPTAYDGVTQMSYPLLPPRSGGGDSVPGANANPAGPAPPPPFVHLFETRGILQHGDFGPETHLTDLGAAKVAAHLTQFIKLTFGWDIRVGGSECVPNLPLLA